VLSYGLGTSERVEKKDTEIAARLAAIEKKHEVREKN